MQYRLRRQRRWKRWLFVRGSRSELVRRRLQLCWRRRLRHPLLDRRRLGMVLVRSFLECFLFSFSPRSDETKREFSAGLAPTFPATSPAVVPTRVRGAFRRLLGKSLLSLRPRDDFPTAFLCPLRPSDTCDISSYFSSQSLVFGVSPRSRASQEVDELSFSFFPLVSQI